MKKKEFILVIVVLVGITLLVGGFLFFRNVKNKQEGKITEEYTPQEEISQEQLRQTMITLYYQNRETKEIMPEVRKVDVSVLSKTPYEYLLSQLLEGPKNEKLEKVLPEGAKLNKIELQGDVLVIDFSKEFITNAKQGKEEEEKIITSIVHTVTELNEVNGIKIVIEGEEGSEFQDKQVNFKEVFKKQN